MRLRSGLVAALGAIGLILTACSAGEPAPRTFTSDEALDYFKDLNAIEAQGDCPDGNFFDVECETTEILRHKSITIAQGTTIPDFEFESPFSGEQPASSDWVTDKDITAWCFLAKLTKRGPDADPDEVRYSYPCFDMSGFGAQRLGYLQEDGSIAPAAYSICLSRFYREEQSTQFLDCIETRESIQPTW